MNRFSFALAGVVAVSGVLHSGCATAPAAGGHSTAAHAPKAPDAHGAPAKDAGAHGGGHAAASVPPAEALARLRAGNARYAANKTEHPRQGATRRTELAGSQAPFAVVVGCADSRTAPELVFDQGLGDLFVLRVAGNGVEEAALGSIEYAVGHLGSSLIVVMGHERCGAVKAAREAVAHPEQDPGHLRSIVEGLRPAVQATVGADAEETGRQNVLNMVNKLRTSDPVLKPLVEQGKVQVVGARYDLDTGLVEFLADAAPTQH